MRSDMLHTSERAPEAYILKIGPVYLDASVLANGDLDAFIVRSSQNFPLRN